MNEIKDFHLSPHFTFYEMTNTQHRDLLELNRREALNYLDNLKFLCNEVLEPLRSFLGSPLLITSGFRCQLLNSRIKGSPRSYHMKGLAADFILPHSTREKLFKAYEEIALRKPVLFDQLIFEMGSWIHIGVKTELEGPNRFQTLVYNGHTYEPFTTTEPEVANV